MKVKSLLILLFLENLSAQIYVPYRSDSLWGVADTNLKIIAKHIYHKVEFSNYIRYKSLKLTYNNKFGIFYNGNVIIPAKFDLIHYNDDFWIAKKGEKHEYFNDFGVNLLGDSLAIVNDFNKIYSKNIIDGNRIIQFVSAKGNYYIKAYNFKTQNFSKNIIQSAYRIEILNFNDKHIDDFPLVKGGPLPGKSTQIACIIRDAQYNKHIYVITKNEKNEFSIKLADSLQITAINEYKISKKGNSGKGTANRLGNVGPSGSNRHNDDFYSQTSNEEFKNYKIIYSEFYIKNQELWHLEYINKYYKSKLNDTIKNELVNCDDCKYIKIEDCYRKIIINKDTLIKSLNYAVLKQKNKWYIYDWPTLNTYKIGFDSIHHFFTYYENQTYKTSIHNSNSEIKYGLINLSKGTELKPEYDSFSNFNKTIKLAHKGGKIYFYNENLEIFSSGYDSIQLSEDNYQNYTNVYLNNKVKFVSIHNGKIEKQSPWVDKKYKILSPSSYDEFYIYPIYNSNGQFLGYISNSGKVFFKT